MPAGAGASRCRRAGLVPRGRSSVYRSITRSPTVVSSSTAMTAARPAPGAPPAGAEDPAGRRGRDRDGTGRPGGPEGAAGGKRGVWNVSEVRQDVRSLHTFTKNQLDWTRPPSEIDSNLIANWHTQSFLKRPQSPWAVLRSLHALVCY